jgi:hypothetical protein
MKSISVVGLKLSIPGGGSIGGMVNSTDVTKIVDYKFYRLGYTNPSVLQQSGDIILMFGALFVLFCVVLAIEFVLQLIPYVRNICTKYRMNFLNAGMSFIYLKLAFDSGYSLMFFDASTTGEMISSGTSIIFLSVVCLYPGWLGY